MRRASFIRKPVLFETNYTQLPNLWARDERIGWRAKGILLFLMSHKNGWRTSLEHLANEGPDGLAAIRTAINELEQVGYLKRETTQTSSDWIISDPFTSENQMVEDEDAFDFSEDTSENRSYLTFENQRLNKTNIKNTNKEYIASEFESFWKLYPRKVGRGAAEKAFTKALSKSSADEIMSGLMNYAQSRALPEMQFIPHAATWLNQERWTDIVEHSAAASSTSSVAEDIIRRSRLIGEQLGKEIES